MIYHQVELSSDTKHPLMHHKHPLEHWKVAEHDRQPFIGKKEEIYTLFLTGEDGALPCSITTHPYHTLR